MKCDICFTPIPIGKHECPNCGFKYRTKASIIKSSTMDIEYFDEEQKTSLFDHIDTKAKMPGFDHIQDTFKNRNNRTARAKKSVNTNQASMEGIGSIIAAIIFLIFFIFSFIF